MHPGVRAGGASSTSATSYYVSYMLATGAIEGVEGETFVAGRLGEYEITKDPTARRRRAAVLMGPFTVYTIENVEEGI